MRRQANPNTKIAGRHIEIGDREKYLRRLKNNFTMKARRAPKPPPPPHLIEKMRITRRPYTEIREQIGNKSAELGGLLISRTLDYTITDFIFDLGAGTNRWVYQPNTDFLNSVLKGRNEEFVGIAHSHAARATQLSSQDQNAAWSNMTSPGNPHLNAYLMPLIQTIPDTGRFAIIPYILTCHPSGNGRVIVHRVKLQIIDE
jgi:hypothetical protein